jgi:anti-sigma regulatory factor (Ser/Thr protein kinase)
MMSMTHRTRTRRFAQRPSEIAAARWWVREVLAAWGMSDHAMALELAVSELVTNAIVHGEGTVGVTLEAGVGELRLVVTDQGHGVPRPRQGATVERGAGGWGLGLVDDLADGWGTLRTDDGTAVWLVRRTAENAEAGLGRGRDRMGTHR